MKKFKEVFLSMISTEIKNLSEIKRELTITMEKEDLEPIREKQIKRVRKEVQFPGFRKGKAPLGVIKNKYADTIEAYTIDAAIEEGFKKATRELDLVILGQPEAKKVDFTEQGDMISVIEFQTNPEVKLQEYKGLSFVKDKYIITDKTVDSSIEQLLHQKAEIETVEGPIEKGQQVVLDLQELDEQGEPLPGKSYNDISIKVGEGRFDPELEEQLYGLKNGAEKRIEKIYPEDYPQKEMAGKKEIYLVKVKNVQKEILPVLDDEFIKDLNYEDIKTVEDLQRVTKENLEKQYTNEAENRLSEDIAQALVDKNPVEVPQPVLDDYLERIIRDVRKKQPDLKMKDEEIRRNYEAEALFSLKWSYLREQIIKEENISVSKEDEEKFLAELENPQMREIYEKYPELMAQAKNEILYRKVIQFLIENSKIEENEIKLD